MKEIKFQGGADQASEAIQVETFKKVLKQITSEAPVMIEIGSNDCFYSLTFNETLPNSTNICVEISKDLMEIGKSNVKLNEAKNFHFIWGGVGKADFAYLELEKSAHPHYYTDISQEKFTVKDLYDKFNLTKVDIIHMDICGTEVEVLTEIVESGLKVDYLFISTHPWVAFNSPTHQTCIDILNRLDVEFLFSDDSKGGCGDGLIVCRIK